MGFIKTKKRTHKAMAGLASINVKFKVDLREFSTEMQSALREIDKFGQKMQSVGRGMSAAITAPILLAGGASIKLASDVEESTNKVNVAFGTSSDVVKDFSKTTLDSYGIASGTALEMASLFGDMATSMGLPQAAAAKMSTSLVGLAGDLSSFKNIGIEQAQTALAGIFTGETESLKKLGIVMTEAALQEYAYAQGIRTKVADMGQAEKVQLRYNYVLEKTKNAQGDFERTGGGAANQTRGFTQGIMQLSAEIGKVLLPLYTKLITALNSIVAWFSELSDGTKRTIVVVAGLAAAIGPLLIVVGALASAIPAIVAGFAAIGVTSAAALGPIGLVVAALGAIAYVIIENWAPIKKELVDFANRFVDLYNNSLVFRSGIEGIILVFKTAWSVGKFVFNALWETIKLVGRNVFTLFSSMGKLIKAVLTFDAEGIKSAISEGLAGGLSDNLGLFFKAIKKDAIAMSDEISASAKAAMKQALDPKKIQKIVITEDKVDAGGVTEAVSKAAAAGAGGAKGAKGNKRVQGIKSSLQPAGLVDSKTPEITIATDKMLKEMEAKAGGIKSILEASREDYVDYGTAVSDSLQQLAANAAIGFGETLGAVLSGTAGIGAIFSGLMGMVANFMKDLGKSLVQIAVANIALKKAFANPFVALAAGVALIALGSMFQNKMSDGPQKFENGGIVGGSSFYGDKIMARVNSGELILNQKQQSSLYSQLNNGSGNSDLGFAASTKIQGSDLLVVIERAEKKKNRLG